MARLVILITCALAAYGAVTVEHRDGAPWPTRNKMRFAAEIAEPAGVPVLVSAQLPSQINPDSIRVIRSGSEAAVPAKTDWRVPDAQIRFRSQGPGKYHIYFDTRGAGETERLPEPAMIGSGDRITYGRMGVKGRLSVGLWAHPVVLDFDGDGKLDLIVGCSDRPYNGIYLFRNLGTNEQPLFDRAEWLGPGKKDLVGRRFQRRRRSTWW